MKKSLLALAVLASAAGAAQAASSVTLYGRIDVGYEKFSNNDLGAQFSNNGNNGFNQTGNEDSRFGIKGQEDLGHGLAATFQFEGRLNADTGSYETERFFHRESTVGLKGAFGHVRLGRSQSAMERALGNFAPGERVTTAFDPYSSSTRHDNSLFYDFDYAGLNLGGNITTKNGADEIDGASAITRAVAGNSGLTNATFVGNAAEGNQAGQSRVSYGLHASYDGTINDRNSYSIAAAYQQDSVAGSVDAFDSATGAFLSTTNARATTREWGVGAQYNFKPIGIGGSYADLRGKDDIDGFKSRTWSGYITADITANDAVYARYISKRERVSGVTTSNIHMWGLGYKHNLSKRTSVYADVAQYKDKLANDRKTTGFDFAVRHAF